MHYLKQTGWLNSLDMYWIVNQSRGVTHKQVVSVVSESFCFCANWSNEAHSVDQLDLEVVMTW